MDEIPEVTSIKIEKRLCGALMRQWAPIGMSVFTLAEDAANEIEQLRRVNTQQRAALEVIAGIRPAIDSLMGNVDIAGVALQSVPKFQAPDTGHPQGPSKDTASEPSSAVAPPTQDKWEPWPNSYNPNNTTQLG